jgi:SurA-like protein
VRAHHSPRLRTRSRLLVAGAGSVAAVLLSGCGADLHPGVAAVVNGETISQGRIDDLVSAACDYTKLTREGSAQGSTSASLGLATLRTSLTTALVQFTLTEAAAEELDVSVTDAQVTNLASGNPMPDGISDDAKDVISEFFYDASKTQLLQGVIGVHLKDSSVTHVDNVTQEDVNAAADYMKKYFEKADVEINPSYGRWSGNSIDEGSGSLSDPIETTKTTAPLPGQPAPDPLEKLPDSQKCG